MMLVAIDIPLQFLQDPIILMTQYPEAPSSLTLGLWLQLWLQGWLWLLLPIGIFQIVLNFPDWRPPSARWDWINTVALGTLFMAALVWLFKDQIGLINNLWTVENPLGFFPPGVFIAGSLIWTIGLFVVAIGSLVSLFRPGYYHRSLAGFFVLYLGPVFPLAIGNAILRYWLYEIDILIRRTLVYSALTAILALVYFGAVTLLQNLLSAVSGQQSTVAIVISTLAMPVRNQFVSLLCSALSRARKGSSNAYPLVMHCSLLRVFRLFRKKKRSIF